MGRSLAQRSAALANSMPLRFLVATAVLLMACSSTDPVETAAPEPDEVATAVVAAEVASSTTVTAETTDSVAATSPAASTSAPSTTIAEEATVVQPTTAVPTTSPAPATTLPTTSSPATTSPATSAPATTASVPSTGAETASYGMPVADAAGASYARDHHDYPASDVFVGCGASIVAPIDGKVLEVRRADGWTAAEDNPATRGGKSVTIIGVDGVRYYFAHFDSIDPAIEFDVPIVIGQRLGLMGRTGRAGACHLHFAISPPCPGKEWSVRRGVIWPWPYLDAWRRGEQFSPVVEVEKWLKEHPDACAIAMADPNARDG